MKHHRTSIAIGALLALMAVGTSRAAELVEKFDNKDSALQGTLKPGKEGAWTATLGKGGFTLVNSTDDKALRVFPIDSVPGSDSSLADATVEVDVRVDSKSNPAGAGILYRCQPATPTFLIFALLGSGNYTVLANTAGKNTRQVGHGSVDGLKPGANRLAVHSDGDKVQFDINGTPVFTVTVRNAPGKSVGIAAMGKGRFTFDNLTVRTAT